MGNLFQRESQSLDNNNIRDLSYFKENPEAIQKFLSSDYQIAQIW